MTAPGGFCPGSIPGRGVTAPMWADKLILQEVTNMELQWYHGREVTEQERKAITEALGDYAYALNDEDIQRWIDDSTITLNGCRSRHNSVD